MSTTSPIHVSEFMARLRAKAEASKAALQADPSLEALIAARIAEHDASLAADGRRYREASLEAMGVPRRLWEQLDMLDETDATRIVAEWDRGPKSTLVLEGGVGTGKTVAAADWIARRGAGLFRKARDVATLSSFDCAAWRELAEVPRLVIDDVGTEPLDDKGWALSSLLGLLDRRYDADLATVITTNLSFETMRARYGIDGGRFLDRLRESGRWFKLSGESLRRTRVA